MYPAQDNLHGYRTHSPARKSAENSAPKSGFDSEIFSRGPLPEQGPVLLPFFAFASMAVVSGPASKRETIPRWDPTIAFLAKAGCGRWVRPSRVARLLPWRRLRRGAGHWMPCRCRPCRREETRQNKSGRSPKESITIPKARRSRHADACPTQPPEPDRHCPD